MPNVGLLGAHNGFPQSKIVVGPSAPYKAFVKPDEGPYVTQPDLYQSAA